MNDETLKIIQEYQRFEKATGENRLRYLEAKIAAQAELSAQGYDRATVNTVLRALPSTLAFREFLAGARQTFDAADAVEGMLSTRIARDALSLAEAETEAALYAKLAAMKPAQRMTTARELGIRL